MSTESFSISFVVILLLVSASFIMLLATAKKDKKSISFFISVLSILSAVIVLIPYTTYIHSSSIYSDVFNNMLIFDTFSALFSELILLGALLTLVIGQSYIFRAKNFNAESFALFLFAIFGMIMMNISNELFSIFISLEIASIAIYTLVGLQKESLRSAEAYLKYLVLGSFSGAFYLFGIVFILLQTGSTHIDVIGEYVSLHSLTNMPLLVVGGILLMITLMFKIASIPFGFWVLDVYDGAALPITAFMAGAFKIAIFAVVLRIFIVDFMPIEDLYDPLLIAMAIITLVVGSLLAIAQTSVKRMLAASSIVHTGYLLIGLASLGTIGTSAAPSISFYLIAYFLSSTGAFGILSYISKGKDKVITFESLNGFASNNPYLAIFLSIFMLSLAGFPSTIGFLGKFYLFSGAIESNNTFLALLGALAAFVSIYYYFKVIAAMYFYPSNGEKMQYKYPLTLIAIAISSIAVLWGGIGTGLITFLPGADAITKLSADAILSLQF